MQPHPPPTPVTLHRLLFRALVEMRARGLEQQDKLTYHLADLFHNVVLDMESAAVGQQAYDTAFAALAQRANEKGMDRWLSSALSDLAKQQVTTASVAEPGAAPDGAAKPAPQVS